MLRADIDPLVFGWSGSQVTLLEASYVVGLPLVRLNDPVARSACEVGGVFESHETGATGFPALVGMTIRVGDRELSRPVIVCVVPRNLLGLPALRAFKLCLDHNRIFPCPP